MVKINKDIVTVQDYGQGFLVNEIREDGKTILEAAFSVLNTSGKYREDGAYDGTSLGSFGVGSKITTYLSHWLDVETYRDGKGEQIRFKEGEFESRKIITCDKNIHGTNVRWLPSGEFFTNIEVDIYAVQSLFATLTCLCPGLTIKFNNKGKETIFFSKNGLDDYVSLNLGNKEILNNRLSINYVNGKNKMNAVLTYSANYSSTIVPYVNTGLTEAGPHITVFKTAITRELNRFFKEKKWLKEKEDNLSGEDIQEGLYLVFNLTTSGVTYDAQVKSRVVNIDTKEFIQEFCNQFQVWLNANEKEIKKIADKAISARKAREAAKKARDAIRNTTEKKSALLNLPTKLVDAWSKNRASCELLIAEGDSAANGLISARNGETQAVFPIRGKIISTYKNSLDKILANQEVVNIIKALGLDMDKKTNKLVYDINKLRYDKIILCADGDADGQSIKNLLLTFFWFFCPELVTQGHLYVAIPPLFRITTKKNEYIYLRDGVALDDYKTKHPGEKFQINRAKGLGEQDPEELDVCLLNPETRNVAQVKVSDVDLTNKLFEIFMGTATTPRKDYLTKYSEEADEV